MATSNTKLVKSESLPLLLPQGFNGQQLFFPDDQYIRDKKIMSLFLTPGVFGQTYTDGKRIAQYDVIPFAYLTLESYSGVQFVRKKPLIQFINYNNFGPEAANFFNFIGQRVNWPKSYVEFGVGVPAVTDQYLLFDVQFTELKEETIKKELGVGFNNKS